VNYAAVNALILIAYTPWLSSLLKQTKRLHEHFWAKFPTVAELRTVLFDLYLYGGFRASLCLLTLAMLGIAIWTLRGRVRLLVPLMILSFVTPGLLLLISLQRPVFISRLMLWTAIPFSVLLAVGLSSFRRPLYWTLFATLLLVGADNLDGVHYRSRHKPNFRAAMLDIAARDNAVAVLAAGRENRVFHYYTERQTNPITGLRFFSAVYKETRVLPIDDRIRGAESVFVVQARNWPTVSRVMAAVSRRGTYVRSRDYGHHLRVHEFRMRSQGLL